MAYLGSKPASNFITTAKQRVTSSTNNYVDLDHAISTLADVIVWVNYVKQDATNLSLTTSTRITLGGTLTASDVVEIAYLGKAVATQNPSDNSVTNDMLSGSIANSKLANSSITLNGSAVSLGGSATISSDAGTESFLAFLSSNQSVSDNTETLVGFDTESYDVGSNYTNSSTFKYTVPSAGKYRFYTQVSGATDGSYAINNTFIRLKKNGSSNIIYNSSPTHQNSNAPDTAQATIDVTLDCSANDYFQIYANINSTGVGITQTNIYSDSSRRTFFGGYRIA